MLKVVIVDDEQHCIGRLTMLLEKVKDRNIKLSGTATSVDEGLKCIEKYNPDLVFLDVEIGGKTGFDLLRSITSPTFKVIFTTAHDRYAIQAIKFCALDYLLKPIDEDDFNQAISKVVAIDNVPDISMQITELLKGIEAKPKKIGLPTINGIVFVAVSDIIRCQADGNYTEFYLNNKQKLVVSKTLKEFEGFLTPYNFFRVHNSNLVNLEFVKSYNKGKGGFLILEDNSTVEVSSRRKDELLKKLSLI
ncbi:MAG: response regulator transcription factor [Bacteroidetes bacterium]|nr:response regulator transcription factor [Bacteroidota bacterium]